MQSLKQHRESSEQASLVARCVSQPAGSTWRLSVALGMAPKSNGNPENPDFH